MKNIIFFILLIGVNSCVKEYETTTRFYIQNNSNKNLNIYVFNANINLSGINIDTNIVLPSGTEYSCFQIISGKNSPSFFPFGVSADSAQLYVNNKLFITYKQKLRYEDKNTRNILDVESFEGGQVNEDLYEYLFSFTDEYLDSVLILE